MIDSIAPSDAPEPPPPRPRGKKTATGRPHGVRLKKKTTWNESVRDDSAAGAELVSGVLTARLEELLVDVGFLGELADEFGITEADGLTMAGEAMAAVLPGVFGDDPADAVRLQAARAVVPEIRTPPGPWPVARRAMGSMGRMLTIRRELADDF